MKTMKLIKHAVILTILFCALLNVTVSDLNAQEEKDIKKIRLKVIKDKDGIYTEIDTSFEIMDDEKLIEMIKFKDLDDSAMKDLDHKIEDVMIQLELDDLETSIKNNLDDSLLRCRIITTYDIKDDGKSQRIIIKENDEDTELIKDINGIFITNPGKNRTVNVYINIPEGNIFSDSIAKVSVKAKKNGKYKVKFETGSDIDIYNDSLLETIQIGIDGKDEIIVMAKVIIMDAEDDDIKDLYDSGVKIETANSNKLDVEGLDFYPNPSSGLFTLKFFLQDKGDTKISIYDMSGREVYHDLLKDFTGSYEDQIDLSGKADGTYFIHISQNSNYIVKKIILN